MNVDRIIAIYNKSNEEFVEDININYIKLDQLKQIFNPKSDDPQMYYCYEINEKHAVELNRYLKFKFDFENFIYSLEVYSSI